MNELVLPVPWEGIPAIAETCETDEGRQPTPSTGGGVLLPGPVGDYLEVVDVDLASQCAYAPVDLNHPHLLARKGLGPSDGDPQFHQQMVYAVAMYTIANFERALGRPSLWACRDYHTRPKDMKGVEKVRWEFVRRLRVYPHAAREANAYYSPEKKALLFGYFPAPSEVDARSDYLPSGMVFTCLSHDIIAHETSHALLDGMHRRLIEPVNADTLAFHEAFADLVALLQHFTLPEVLKHQIAKTRGDLRRQNLLGELAQQFGKATGGRGALRSALGGFSEKTGRWEPAQPDPTALQRIREPHHRGAILVGAVFEAFLSIYQGRVADLLRIATNGTGVLPDGDLHPDLVHRLSEEAAKSARHVLTMCIRALDYLPPTDVDFGSYLRGLITSDYDLVRRDSRGYRVALTEAFRRWGIFPRGLRSLSEDVLRWECPKDRDGAPWRLEGLERLHDWVAFRSRLLDREEIHLRTTARAVALRKWLEGQEARTFQLLGLRQDLPPEVHSVRLGKRVSPDGTLLTNVVVQITQRRPGFLDSGRQKRADARGDQNGDFWFRGGCTLILDPDTLEVLYCIRKNIDSDSRLERQRRFLGGESGGSLRATYFGGRDLQEPFALLHRAEEEEAP